MITFTELAQEQIGKIVTDAGDECAGIRVRAHKLGKYTFRYEFQLVRDEELNDDDTAVDAGTFTAHVGPGTAENMKGAKIDFIIDGDQAGFKIDNPAAFPVWDDPIARKVQLVIDGRLLPSLSEHGGWLELNRVEGDTAYVSLGGGCQGCASANETIKNGVEQIITQDVPEINHVIDETDHGLGTSPYQS